MRVVTNNIQGVMDKALAFLFFQDKATSHHGKGNSS